ncbi:minor tail protein L [Escherichia coli]|nr:minor tail protein L [Escherichia coli]
MQDIHEEKSERSVKSEQSPRVVLWEIDLTVQGGERYFFCNELNEKGEAVTWQGRQYQAYPIDGSGFEMNGKGSSARPSLTVVESVRSGHRNAEDLQSLVGPPGSAAGVCPFLGCGEFCAGQSGSGPGGRLSDRWWWSKMSELTAMTASFVLAHRRRRTGRCFLSHHAGEHLYVGLPGR